MSIPEQNSLSHAAEARIYREIAAATIKLLAEGPAVILPRENPEVFDVSLVAGHAGLFEIATPDFDDLAPFVEEPLRELCSFDMLEIVPSAQAHLTIFPLFQNKPRSFGSPEALPLRARQYDKIIQALEGIGPLIVNFEGLCVAPTGAVILTGICDAMPAIRKHLHEALPDNDRALSRISHVTLARLKRSASRVECSLYAIGRRIGAFASRPNTPSPIRNWWPPAIRMEGQSCWTSWISCQSGIACSRSWRH